MEGPALRRGQGVEPCRRLACTNFINCHEGLQPPVEDFNSLQCRGHKISGANCSCPSLLRSFDSRKCRQIAHVRSSFLVSEFGSRTAMGSTPGKRPSKMPPSVLNDVSVLLDLPDSDYSCVGAAA
jgi:hypothetical protein